MKSRGKKKMKKGQINLVLVDSSDFSITSIRMTRTIQMTKTIVIFRWRSIQSTRESRSRLHRLRRSQNTRRRIGGQETTDLTHDFIYVY